MGELDPVLIGAQIRKLRLARGLTQQHLTGPKISPGYISLIELGKRLPSAKVLKLIAEALNVNVQDIVAASKTKELLSEIDNFTLLTLDLAIRRGDLVLAHELYAELSSSAQNTYEGRCAHIQIRSLENPTAHLFDESEKLLFEVARNFEWQLSENVLVAFARIGRVLALYQQLIISLTRFHDELKKLKCNEASLLAAIFGSRSYAWLALDNTDEALRDANRAQDLRTPLNQDIRFIYQTVKSGGNSRQVRQVAEHIREEVSVENLIEHLRHNAWGHYLVAETLYRSESTDTQRIQKCLSELNRDALLVDAGLFVMNLVEIHIAQMHIHFLQGDFDATSKLADILMAEESLTSQQQLDVLLCLARLYLRRGSGQDAIAHLDRAEDLIRNKVDRTICKWHIRATADILQKLGQTQRAFELLQLIVGGTETTTQVSVMSSSI